MRKMLLLTPFLFAIACGKPDESSQTQNILSESEVIKYFNKVTAVIDSRDYSTPLRWDYTLALSWQSQLRGVKDQRLTLPVDKDFWKVEGKDVFIQAAAKKIYVGKIADLYYDGSKNIYSLRPSLQTEILLTRHVSGLRMCLDYNPIIVLPVACYVETMAITIQTLSAAFTLNCRREVKSSDHSIVGDTSLPSVCLY